MGVRASIAPVRFTSRSILRHSWLATALLALLLVLIGGAVLATLAGARRTESAYPRLVEATDSTDVAVVPVVGTVDFGAVAALPQVAESGRLRTFQIAPVQRGGVPDLDRAPDAFASDDGRLFYTIAKPQVLEGRAPRRGAVEEIMINEAMAAEFDLEVGSPYPGALINFPVLLEFAENGRPPSELDFESALTPVDLEVVGVERSLEEIIPVEDARNDSIMTVSPAFAARYRDQAVTGALSVKLRDPDRDLESFRSDVSERFPDATIEFVVQERRGETVERSVRPYSLALFLFAAVVGITGVLVLGQLVARQVALDARDVPIYRAIGLSPTQSIGTVIARSVVIAAAGAVGAVVLAALVSRFFPFGQARRSEPDPGFDLDGVVLGLGAVMIFVVVVAWAAVAGWRVVSRSRHVAVPTLEEGARPSAVASRLSDSGLPPAPTTGVRFALERQGVLAGPVVTLTGLVVAVGAMTATIAFTASLHRVVSTPRLYGWNWDVALEGYDGTNDAVADEVERDRDVIAQTVGARTTVRIGNEDLLAYGFETGRGQVRPTVVDGRLPRTAGEIALGARSFDDLGVAMGDTVRAVGFERNRLRVVGTAVLPVLARGGTVGLAEGAALTLGGLERIDPQPEQEFIAADVAPGATIGEIRDRYDTRAAVETPQPPSELVSYRRLDAVLNILVAVLGLLGASILAHAVITSIRRRRRAVAVLKALGFVRPQVGIAVATEATTLAALAVLVGVPLGLIVGRWGWSAFADRLGVVVEPVTPFPFGVMAVAVGALVLANLVAALPSRSAARTHPAQALRSE